VYVLPTFHALVGISPWIGQLSVAIYLLNVTAVVAVALCSRSDSRRSIAVRVLAILLRRRIESQLDEKAEEVRVGRSKVK
jgi:hypothetical protein